MNPSETKKSEPQSDQDGEDSSPTPKEKERAMPSASSDSKLNLSCWWSRGPAGQVQEWESRPTTSQKTPRVEVEHRGSSTRWVKTSRNKQKSKS